MSEEIHNLLKIENDKTTIFTNKELKMIDDYINELEAYKYNMDRDYLRLEKENKKLKEVIEKAIEYIRIYRSYQKINDRDYLKGRDEIGCLDICQVDELLDILKEVSE